MKNSKYILAGMSAFCLVLITATSIKSSFLMPLRTGVGFVLVPLQSGVNAIGTGLYNTLENFSSLREAQEENKNLQMRLDQMVEENNRLQSELYELDRLRELYQLDQEYMQYKPAFTGFLQSPLRCAWARSSRGFRPDSTLRRSARSWGRCWLCGWGSRKPP